MPVKDFILLVVYLLVPLACNFAKKTPFVSELRQSRDSHSLNGDIKEGRKKTLKANTIT